METAFLNALIIRIVATVNASHATYPAQHVQTLDPLIVYHVREPISSKADALRRARLVSTLKMVSVKREENTVWTAEMDPAMDVRQRLYFINPNA